MIPLAPAGPMCPLVPAGQMRRCDVGAVVVFAPIVRMMHCDVVRPGKDDALFQGVPVLYRTPRICFEKEEVMGTTFLFYQAILAHCYPIRC